MIMMYCMFPTTRTLLADNWYSLSYLYFSPIGTIVVISVGLLVSLFTGKLHICYMYMPMCFAFMNILSK